MTRTRIWLLPALLGAAQLAWWPGVPWARDSSVEAVRAAAVVAVTVVVCAALGWRRHAPVAALAVVAAGVGLGTWAAPDDQLLALAIAAPVALFSVAVCCPRRTALVAFGVLEGWQAVVSAIQFGFGGDFALDVAASFGADLFIVAAGRLRRRWVAERVAAAGRLAAAEEAERGAADVERHRLARELHDVTAHHLTSIVVQASAARMLGEQRPELRAAALDHAARTGRDTLVALRRLVTILPFGVEAPSAPVPRLADLADDFRQLGQVVTVETEGEAPDEVAEAVHAIAREALTNTLRYAPGGTVKIRFSYGPGAAELVVEDDGAAATQATGLGGGRGLAGMEERARALGATFSAGPRPGAGKGWRVHVVLPPPATAVPTRRLRQWLRSQVVFDAGLAGLILALPLLTATVVIDEEHLAPSPATLLLLAVAARSAPLLWRRRHPWVVLAVVLPAGWLVPALMLSHVVPVDVVQLYPVGVGADLAAVYAVGAWVRPGLSWLGPVAALVSAAVVTAAMLIGHPPDRITGIELVVAVGVSVAFLALLYVPVLGASWLSALGARRRRQRRLEREEGAVAYASARAEWRAADERARVAAGLREAVVEHAARVPAAAEEADLTAVVDSARAALGAMRALLDGMEVPSSPSAYSSSTTR